MQTTQEIQLTGTNLRISDVVHVSRNAIPVSLSPEAIVAVRAAERMVEDLAQGDQVVYGITTGFGKFSSVMISASERANLQQNLLRSHAVGVGEPYSPEVARAMMLLRANSLALGHSGIRLQTLQLLLDMLNCGVTPVIPQKGSVGASGDLAPLSHMALVLIGEGTAWFKGERLPGAEALRKAGLQPVQLGAKEGLALINGTQAMAAMGALAVYDGMVLLKSADLLAAMATEALSGIVDAFDPRIHALRPHPGQGISAANLRLVLEGSGRTTRQGEVRLQDAYSLRCTPQVHGASRDALDYVWRVMETEINSATDNPLLFPDQHEVLSGGNFHGQPLALALDFAAIAMAELASIAERRVERMVNPALSGLPAFLIRDGGLHSGLMITQYTAAALVSENKVLSHPASVDSIPTSANQEDHVSIGNISARKLRDILWNTTRVLSIEAICAAQALELDGENGRMGRGTGPAYACLRTVVPHVHEDRYLADEIEAVAQLIVAGKLLAAAEGAVGTLH